MIDNFECIQFDKCTNICYMCKSGWKCENCVNNGNKEKCDKCTNNKVKNDNGGVEDNGQR